MKVTITWVLVAFASLASPLAAQAQTFQDWSWTRQPLTSSDAPYQPVRERLGKLHKENRISAAGIAPYKNAALRSPGDPVARFAWGYYAFCLGVRQKDWSEATIWVYPAIRFFEEQTSPGSYQYTRIRFLMLSIVHKQGPEMKLLGERLLRRDANDYHVKFFTARALGNGSDAEALKGIRYGQQLVNRTPLQPVVHGELGFSYQRYWWRHKRPEDARKAIASFRRYIDLAQPTGKARSQLESNIRTMEKSL